MKRTKTRKNCANPLFEKWLMEWKDEAKVKGSYLEKHFTKAIESLQKYPLRLETGRDCMLLQHFGSKLCAMLDRKLKDHNECNRLSKHYSDLDKVDPCDEIEADLVPKKSRSLDEPAMSMEFRSEKECPSGKKIPIRRSRTHSMSSSDSNNDDLDLPIEIEDTPVTNSKKCTKKDTATSNQENSTGKQKNNGKFRKNSPTKKKQSPDTRSLENETESLDSQNHEEFYLTPDNFDVILLVDTHETGSTKTKSKEDATKSELDRLSVKYEIRHLKIGDFAWIARCRDTNRELILPYIVERKRMDDLASSIKDGRFHEQKFRLQQSGIPNIIYMVESHNNNQHLGIPLPTLLQASVNSLVQDDFTIKFTNSHRDSMRYLSIFTNLVHQIYKEKLLCSSKKREFKDTCASPNKVSLPEFNLFNKAASKIKTFKVKEMFVRQLLQLKGLSLEKVLAIVEHYPTPAILIKAFEDAGDEAEKLLMPIKVGSLRRQLGASISKTVYELYTKNKLQ